MSESVIQLVTILAETVGIFVAIVTGGFFIIRKVANKAYDDGTHDTEHKELRTDVDAAHEGIRKNGERIANVEKDQVANREAHKSMMKSLDSLNDKQDKILDFLIERKS